MIRDGGCSEHDDQVDVAHAHDGSGEGARIVRDSRFGDDGCRGGRKPLLQGVQRLGHRRRLQRRQHGRSDADAQRLKRDDHHRSGADGRGLPDMIVADGKRDDLHGRDHLAGVDRLERLQRRHRDRLVDGVDRVDRLLVDADKPGSGGQQVAAARKGAIESDVAAGNMPGETESRRILVDVAGLQSRPDDRRDAGLLESCNVLRSEELAFPELEA